ncbi:MAG: AMP-binding protein [Flavobacteriaceae bacterium]|nr:AMP-binding protein [Flavobacteriaceae bacterium]
MTKNSEFSDFFIDFSNESFQLPIAKNSQQQEIIDFINYFFENEMIPVQTSGSTGTPKKILLPKKAMLQSASMTASFLNLKRADSALMCLPVQYIAGKMMIVRAVHSQMKIFFTEPKTQILIEQPYDFCAMTPMQAQNSMKDLHQIQTLILGGAQVTHQLENQLAKIPSRIYETYAMTETITHIAMRQLNHQKAFHTLENIEISSDQRDCLVIKTPYFHEKIQTNDVVEILNDKSFKLLGRIDNIINSGGIKINPETLENLLRPYISHEFIVHFKTDSKLGQKVVLVIEANEIAEITYPADLIPKNQQPKEVVFVPKLPRTPNGKVKRGALEF